MAYPQPLSGGPRRHGCVVDNAWHGCVRFTKNLTKNTHPSAGVQRNSELATLLQRPAQRAYLALGRNEGTRRALLIE
jgi:hypothetical protein